MGGARANTQTHRYNHARAEIQNELVLAGRVLPGTNDKPNVTARTGSMIGTHLLLSY